MGRTNYIILAIGMGSMLLLSVLMKQFLDRAQSSGSPAVHELAARFGARLSAESELRFERTENGMRVTVTLYPMLGAGVPELAREVGQHMWTRLGDEQIASVEVLCRWSGSHAQRFEVPRPGGYGKFRRSDGGGNAPAARTGPPGQKKSTTTTPPAPVPGREAR